MIFDFIKTAIVTSFQFILLGLATIFVCYVVVGIFLAGIAGMLFAVFS